MQPILIKANNYRVKCVEYNNLTIKYFRLVEDRPDNSLYKTSYKRYFKLAHLYFEKYDTLIKTNFTRSQITNAGAREGKYLTLGFLRKLDKLKGK